MERLDRMIRGDRTALVSRADRILSQTMASLGYPADQQLATDDPEDAAALIDLAMELVVERLGSAGVDAPLTARMAEHVLCLSRLQAEVRAWIENERLDALVSVHQALARLGRAASAVELARHAACELRTSAGFDRTMISWLDDDGVLSPAAASSAEGDAAQPAPVALARGHAESEVVRRRTVLLVQGGPDDPRSAFTNPEPGGSFVAGCIACGGRVVGVVHADRAATGRAIRRLDRDVVGAFAVGLGYALDRTVLAERLRTRREEVRRLMRATEAVMTELNEGDALSPATDPGPAAPMASTLLAPVSAPFDGVLSAREMDVLDAMASGATNAQIAARLYISEETVKSHVKRILRKLGASNRAQAVSRYMRRVSAPAGAAV